MEEVPVVFADDLTDAQRRALTLVDNQTTVMTGWDEDMLAYELDVLAQDFDMGELGFAEAGAGPIDEIEDDGDDLDETVTVSIKFQTVEAYREAIDAITEAAQASGGTVSIR